MAKAKRKKENWHYEYFRCIYSCVKDGKWKTIYVRQSTFGNAFNYLKDHLDVWVIKEISNNLENGELVGKLIEGEDLEEPTIIYPEENELEEDKPYNNPAY